MAEEKGFEPLRRSHDLPVFKTGPFNQTWVFLHKYHKYNNNIKVTKKQLNVINKMVPKAGLEPARGLILAGF